MMWVWVWGEMIFLFREVRVNFLGCGDVGVDEFELFR